MFVCHNLHVGQIIVLCCSKLKQLNFKFLANYFRLWQVKDKTISAGQNIIKDTKDYQDEEWSEEKKKIEKTKKKINDAKNKVLNK